MSNQWKMVPVEPTPEMYAAASVDSREQGILGAGYKAMLAAAPVPPAGDVEVLRNRLESARARFGRWNGRLIESLREERQTTTRLTAERDGLLAEVDRLQQVVNQARLDADESDKSNHLAQSELTKALELLNEWLNMFEGGLKSGDLDSLWNETADYIDPTTHNVDESCGQDAEAVCQGHAFAYGSCVHCGQAFEDAEAAKGGA